MFKWISAVQNKANDCLSRLVELPTNGKATIKMLTAIHRDEPAFNTRSRMSHQGQTTMEKDPSSTQPIKEIVTPDLTTMGTTQDLTLKPLTAKKHEALLQM